MNAGILASFGAAATNTRRVLVKIHIVFYGALFCLSMSTANAEPSTYKLIDLGLLSGGTHSRAYGINALGQVVGYADTASGLTRAFLWTATQGMSDLGTLSGGMNSVARGINNSGQVVGSSSTSSSTDHAFLWDPESGMRDIGTLAGGDVSQALGINNLGRVIGWSAYDSGGHSHAFLWDATSGIHDLGTLLGEQSKAWGINDTDQVVGRATMGTPQAFGRTAFLWDPVQGMRDIAQFPRFSYSTAYSINNRGEVAGAGAGRAFMWDAGGGIHDLGGVHSTAYGINNAGQVVGSSTYNSITEAFLWSAGTGMIYPGPGSAYAINDSGWIVGESSGHAVLWTPVPEPSSILALLTGLAGIGGVAWRRRRV